MNKFRLAVAVAGLAAAGVVAGSGAVHAAQPVGYGQGGAMTGPPPILLAETFDTHPDWCAHEFVRQGYDRDPNVGSACTFGEYGQQQLWGYFPANYPYPLPVAVDLYDMRAGGPDVRPVAYGMEGGQADGGMRGGQPGDWTPDGGGQPGGWAPGGSGGGEVTVDNSGTVTVDNGRPIGMEGGQPGDWNNNGGGVGGGSTGSASSLINMIMRLIGTGSAMPAR